MENEQLLAWVAESGVKTYVYPQETWSAKKCHKAARHIDKDGLGTPYPFRGYYSIQTHVRYNGGTVIDGEWYQSVVRLLPRLAEGFVWRYRLTWGWQIIQTSEVSYACS